VFYKNKENGWSCKDRFMDIFALLSFFEGNRSGSNTTDAKVFKDTPENYVQHLEELDSEQGTKVGHKILEVLADYIPRMKAADAIKNNYMKMKKDAKEHESEDKKKREAIDLKNQADSMVFQGEKQLKEFEGKINQETRTKIQAAIDRLKEAAKGDNASEIKSAIEGYNAAWNEASSQMYSQAKTEGPQQQQSAGPEQQTGGKQDDGKVENADFEVMDDKK